MTDEERLEDSLRKLTPFEALLLTDVTVYGFWNRLLPLIVRWRKEQEDRGDKL